MGWFDKKSPAETAETKSAALDINSPRLLEAIRQGTSGGVSGDNAMRVSAVYSCVKVLSESISSLPVNLYDVSPEGGKVRLNNKLDRLVSIAPSEDQTAAEMWAYVVTSVCLHGNGYLYITRTQRGQAVQLLPLNPLNVSIHVNGNKVAYHVTVGEGAQSKTLVLSSREILHFKSLTLDGYKGLSPITYNSAVVSGDRTAIDYANRIYTEGATPRGVLEVDGVLSDDAYENLRASWGAAHGGTNNGNKVAILESGVVFKPISLTPHDVQLLETRKYSRNEIAGLYRVPPHMIAALDNATYSNIAHQGAEFHRFTLAPWLTMIEQRLNLTLANPGQMFRFDTSGLTRSDLQTESESYSKLISMGVLNPNEVRERMGLNPREGGDEYISQTNNLSFGNSEAPQEQEQPSDDEESSEAGS